MVREDVCLLVRSFGVPAFWASIEPALVEGVAALDAVDPLSFTMNQLAQLVAELTRHR